MCADSRAYVNVQFWAIIGILLEGSVAFATAHHANVKEAAVGLLASFSSDVVESQATPGCIGVKRGNPVGKVHRLGYGTAPGSHEDN